MELQSRRERGTHRGSRHGRNSTLNRWGQSDRERPRERLGQRRADM